MNGGACRVTHTRVGGHVMCVCAHPFTHQQLPCPHIYPILTHFTTTHTTQAKVAALGLGRSGEEAEDLGTADLKFVLVDYYLGRLQQQGAWLECVYVYMCLWVYIYTYTCSIWTDAHPPHYSHPPIPLPNTTTQSTPPTAAPGAGGPAWRSASATTGDSWPSASACGC